MGNNKEAKARIKINKLLEEAGWRLIDSDKGKANVILEENVKNIENNRNNEDLGDNFENTKNGYADYVLSDENGFRLAVLEAKSEHKNPLDGKEQARRYAESLQVRFVLLSNGNIHYLWDINDGNPEIITKFPTQESLNRRKSFKPDKNLLVREEVNEDYIVLTQKPKFKEDPKYQNESTRNDYIKENNLHFLRKYQIDAIRALQKSVEKGNTRFLFEMATGTGKTLISAAVIKLFLRTGNAKRVLFLVDRLELEDQAFKSFNKYLKNDYKSVIYKQNKENWKQAEIVITTVQSLLSQNKYKDLFSPTDFDLLISDEAHRSIGGNARAVFEFFIGYKLGLTATPKNYLKNINIENLKKEDPRVLEKRELLDTYKTFGCENSEPTFRFSLTDGVKEGFLVNPKIIDARTEITTQLLSDEGYSYKLNTKEGEIEKNFYKKDFEKNFFSEETNTVFCKSFIENALKDPISVEINGEIGGEIGKSIVFCVTQDHASKITQILNEIAYQKWPDKYNSDFAVQVTSNIQDAQQLAMNFSNNNLNGKTKFLENYNSCKTRVCVTVGMMTTGYDCRDILNIVLMRPIFSPTEFIQIKGRGTRKYVFEYKDEYGEVYRKEKEIFYLFDFFANFEYFEEKYNYDQILKLPITQKLVNKNSYSFSQNSSTTLVEEETSHQNTVTIYESDRIQTIVETSIGIEGMKIDRKLFEKAKAQIENDEEIKSAVEKGDWNTSESLIREKYENKPELYLTLEKIRKSENLDRRITWREFLERVFGFIDRFKTKEELLEEECEKFISIYKPESEYVLLIKNFFKNYILDQNFRNIIDSKQYVELNTYASFSIDELSKLKKWKDIVIISEYIKDYVNLNIYL